MRVIERRIEEWDMAEEINKLFEGYRRLNLSDDTILYRLSYDRKGFVEIIYPGDKALYEKIELYVNPLRLLKVMDFVEDRFYRSDVSNIQKFVRKQLKSYEMLVYKGRAYRHIRNNIRRWLNGYEGGKEGTGFKEKSAK